MTKMMLAAMLAAIALPAAPALADGPRYPAQPGAMAAPWPGERGDFGGAMRRDGRDEHRAPAYGARAWRGGYGYAPAFARGYRPVVRYAPAFYAHPHRHDGRFRWHGHHHHDRRGD